MNCSKCNNPIDNDSKFCETCGERVSIIGRPQQNNTPNITRNNNTLGNIHTNNPLKKLSEKMWYRMLKVTYIFSYLFFIVGAVFYATDTGWYGDQFSYAHFFEALIVSLLLVIIGAEILKRAFYYILFGTVQPKKHLKIKI